MSQIYVCAHDIYVNINKTFEKHMKFILENLREPPSKTKQLYNKLTDKSLKTIRFRSITLKISILIKTYT